MQLTIAPHPTLDLGAFVTRLPGPLGELPTPEWLPALLTPGATAPLSADDALRSTVRDVLRGFGYKPTGRGKPASEYLVRAVAEGKLSAINLVVDVANAVSLHSGLPISVVDVDRTQAPLSVRLGRQGDVYVFNSVGQTIDVAGLPCLVDAAGPTANAVKDAQRTKTSPTTRTTLSLVWGARSLDGRTQKTVAWYREMLARVGAETQDVTTMAEGA